MLVVVVVKPWGVDPSQEGLGMWPTPGQESNWLGEGAWRRIWTCVYTYVWSYSKWLVTWGMQTFWSQPWKQAKLSFFLWLKAEKKSQLFKSWQSLPHIPPPPKKCSCYRDVQRQTHTQTKAGRSWESPEFVWCLILSVWCGYACLFTCVFLCVCVILKSAALASISLPLSHIITEHHCLSA